MIFDIILSLFAAGAYAAVLVERRGREKRAEQLGDRIKSLAEAVGLVDEHVKEIEKRRVDLLNRLKRKTHRGLPSDVPRDTEAAQWNPKWGVVNGRWTKLDG